MFRASSWALGLAAATLLVGCVPLHVEPVTTRQLLDEMTDLSRLAEFPDPPFTCRQFSSYDRASQSAADHEAWFANHDAGHFLRVEERAGRQEHVLMDAEGPGAIVRIWSANPGGVLRFYFDGATEPSWEVPMDDLLGGKVPGLPPPLAGVRAAGWNLYFPISYARSCKVTNDKGGFYYHVNYRTYPRHVPVETFRPESLIALTAEIAETANTLADPRSAGGLSEATDRLTPLTITVTPGEQAELADAPGPGAIVDLRVRVSADDVERALRQTILHITFDGRETVQVPLGDFFGTAPGLNPYASLPMGVTDDGELWSHWVMPYRASARVTVRNLGDQDVTLSPTVITTPYDWTNRTMHFHAGWRASYDLSTRPMVDWNYCDLRGQGVFVGAAFHITNPVKNWWGEGDEKIYVDGEKFPSHFGTGTEDYFGYAWCSPELFTHAFHNQPRADGPGNYGHSSVNRWHVLDQIPFRRSFLFDMEIWHWAEVKIDAAVTTYWYARPGGRHAFVPLTAADVPYRPVAPYVAARVPGALEGEEMRIIEHTANIGPQDIGDCSAEKHLWWRHGTKPGDRLVVGFEAPAAGTYNVVGRFVTSGDYGIVRLAINGAVAAESLDLYSRRVQVTDELPLGTYELVAGENRFEVEVIGANLSAKPDYMFGLDYLRLEQVGGE